MIRFLFRPVLLVHPPLSGPLFALALPHRLVAVADALWVMVNIDLLLLLLLLHGTLSCPSIETDYTFNIHIALCIISSQRLKQVT
jgi:hypothetical protein